MFRTIKNTSVLAAAVAALGVALVTPASAAVEWEAFVIRQANTQPAATPVTIVEDVDGNGATTLIDEGGEKTGYGTSFFDGQTLSSIPSVSYDRIDPGTKYPYVNVWITDGTNYAVIAPGVVQNGGGVTTSNVNGLDFQSLGMTIYETNFTGPGALNWLYPNAQRVNQALLKADNTPVTIAEIGSLLVGDPGVYPNPPVGTGAPKNGTGLNLIFGDTQSNFDQAIAYQIDNVVVPEPAAFGLLGIGAAAMLLRRRRNA